MAKIEIPQPTGPKVVKTYRIDEKVFDAADAKCKQLHGVSIAQFIEPLLKKYFNIK
jgi:antitoxin component of RelBE/YafQ-DinJ toxin-antitoxin module